MSESAVGNPLRDSPSFRRLWIARTISQVGDGIAVLALVLFVQETHRTGVAVGGLLLAAALPRFLGLPLGPHLAEDRLPDRGDRRARRAAPGTARAPP